MKRLDKENVIVWISACSPLYLLINLRSLETLKILKTLASCGPTLKISTDPDEREERTISKILEITTKKSKLFQLEEKYTVPNAANLSNASTANIQVKIRLII